MLQSNPSVPLASWLAPVLALSMASAASAQLASSLVSSSGPAIGEFGEAFDTARGRGILFGGAQNGSAVSSLYEWTGTSWLNRSPGVRPSSRTRPALAFDAARGETVVFGGSPFFGAFLNDTWVWDGNSFTSRPATGPSPRSGAAMAYDSNRQVVVMFGGFVQSGADANDTWEWNGTAWSQRSPGTRPTPRGAHRMVYDATKQRVVLFGGFSTPSFGTLNDTWEWDGTTWTSVSSAQRPPNRCDQSMVFDEARGRVFMFGGLASFQQPGNVPVVLGDVWELNGSQWQTKSLGGLTPSARTYAYAGHNPATGETIIHSGSTSGTTFSSTYVVSTPNPASVTAFGTGCAGSNGLNPVLSAVPSSNPWIGDTFDVAITDAAPTSAFGIMVIGFSNQTWNGQALPASLASVGLTGCDTSISVDDTSPIGLSGGSGTWTANLTAASTSLIGFNFYLQAGIIDTGVMRATPASVTNALQGTIGAW